MALPGVIGTGGGMAASLLAKRAQIKSTMTTGDPQNGPNIIETLKM